MLAPAQVSTVVFGLCVLALWYINRDHERTPGNNDEEAEAFASLLLVIVGLVAGLAALASWAMVFFDGRYGH